ncbi:MAG: hypothetical protein E6848_28270, partial [Bradyrhizobium sp.]|nr:hypothetical protein [Bradyrhizobium sp.]
MNWPGDTSSSKRTAGGNPLSAFFLWIGGFSAIEGLDDESLTERDRRRIRARQIDAVASLVPVTIGINFA